MSWDIKIWKNKSGKSTLKLFLSETQMSYVQIFEMIKMNKKADKVRKKKRQGALAQSLQSVFFYENERKIPFLIKMQIGEEP